MRRVQADTLPGDQAGTSSARPKLPAFRPAKHRAEMARGLDCVWKIDLRPLLILFDGMAPAFISQ